MSGLEAYSVGFNMLGIDDAEFIVDFTQRFDFGGKYVLPEMLELLSSLRKMPGIELAILSNHANQLKITLRKEGLIPQYFKDDLVIVSALVGLRKPEASMFEYCLKTLGPSVATEDVLFIDNRRVNVEGAEAMGISSILYLFDASKCGPKGEGDKSVGELSQDIMSWISCNN